MCVYINYCLKNRKRLLNRFRKFTGNYEDAYDFYQDLLARLLEKPPQGREGLGEAYIAGYIDEHIKWISMNHLRDQKREFSLDVEDEEEESRIDRLDLTFAQLHDGQLAGVADPSYSLDRERASTAFLERLEAIANPVHREILEEVLVNGVSTKGVADAVGLSTGAVRAVISRFKNGEINETGSPRP
jgi:RNA polymerase sigma factor (sigma-70 family)